MNSIRFRPFLLCVVLLVAATSAVAQNYPFPASTPNTDVKCSLCPSRETLLTIGYPPVLRFVGRWADAESAHVYQQNFRTAQPKMARFVPGRNRIYTLLGSALAAYDADKFFSRLNARPQEQMVAATQVPVSGGNPRFAQFGPAEVFLWWDAFFYAENGSGWITPFEDGQERLWDFDWDDRGNVYLAYTAFGWGIVKDSGDMGGGLLHTLSQSVKASGLAPDHIMSLKTSDGRYYAAASDKNLPSILQIWDVQDPAAPVKQPDIPGRSFYLWAKDSTGSRLGIVEYSGGLSIFSPDAFVRAGGTPIVHFEAGGGGTFRMITGDGTNFYAYGASDSGPFIDVISPSGSTYVETRYRTHGYGLPTGMHYGDGYLAVYGVEVPPVGTWNIRVFKVAPGTLSEIPFEMPVPGNANSQQPFWSMYYAANAPQGYARPSINSFMDVTPVKNGSKIYLIVSALGLGDVWEVKAGDSIAARLSASAEVPNPNSAAAPGTGPFYGDRQSFTSSLGSGNAANVNWDFGDNTSLASITGGTVKHQFGGVTSAASLPLVRHVTASNAADLTMADTLSVTLASPQPGFKLANTSFLFRQPDASSAAPIVSGDSFLDVSDGAVEGHYTDWVLDSASNKKLPSDAFGVGVCGARSLAFKTHYGPYSGTGSSITAPSDLALSISPFNYTVHPYVVTVQEPTPASVGDPNAVFTTALRVGSASDLPGGIGTPVTYTWEVIDASQSRVTSATGSATLGTIPAFSVPRTTFSALGLRVRLTTTIAASAVPGPGCSSLATAVAQSSVLNGPDPVIVKTGCATVGSPCSFTVTSAQNPTLAGWSFAWTLNPTATNSGTTASDFRPQFTTTTDYTVGVTVTNGIGSKIATLTGHIDKPLCSSAPDGFNTAIGPFTNSTPAPGDAVPFHIFPVGWAPSVECDKFAWSFGDGGSSTAIEPTHVYTNAGTYNVTLILTGGLATGNYTTSVTIGSAAPPPPPPPPNNGGCSSSPQANSAYVTYTGPASGCNAVTGSCNPGESLFFVLWPDSGYNLSCGSTTVTWLFGDNLSGSGLSASHTYAAAGTYHAQAIVSNSAGSFTYLQDVRIGNAGPHPCGTLTQQNVALAWTGTGCTESSGTCKSADQIAFRPLGNGYDFTCNATHTYDWDFGDNSAHSTLAQPSHSFAGPGTFTVKLVVSNGTSQTTVTRSLTTSSGSNALGCGVMVPDQNVYISFYGDGCTAISGNCSAKADVAFAVSTNGSYDFSCAPHTYSWDFGDGGHSTDNAPLHRYAADGTYTVRVHVAVGAASVDLTSTARVVNGTPTIPRGGRAVRH